MWKKLEHYGFMVLRKKLPTQCKLIASQSGEPTYIKIILIKLQGLDFKNWKGISESLDPILSKFFSFENKSKWIFYIAIAAFLNLFQRFMAFIE